MKIGSCDLEKDVLLVAEIGNNHEGNFALAQKMIAAAAKAGAQAVKFQTFKTEHFIGKEDKARFQKLKSFELSYKEFKKLSLTARREGVLFISTPLDLDSAVFLSTIVHALKIASGDNNFYPLIDLVAGTGKPVILSGGMADLEELNYTKTRVERIWTEKNIKQEMAVLHCVTSYPVPESEANLSAIVKLKEKLKGTIGYSDHTLGIEAAALSVALGARIIEKHFTLDKNKSYFRDHKLSADPREMAVLAQTIKKYAQLLGTGEKIVQECEKPLLNQVRRSIAAKRDLSAGRVIEWDDIMWIRPAGGLNPGQEHLVLGGTLDRPVSQGERIMPEMLRGA